MKTRLNPAWFRNLHYELLREGRVWDMHDLFMVSFEDDRSATYKTNLGLVIAESFRKPPYALPHGFDLQRVLEKLLQDWQMPDYDESTNLALLDIVSTYLIDMALRNRNAENTEAVGKLESILDLSSHLSHSVYRNDPDNMKSRTFSKWLLCKSIWEEFRHSDSSRQIRNNLRLAKGLGYYPSPASLPVYIPASRENPGWKTNDAPAQFKDALQLITNVARSQEDYMMETLCLTQLIHLTAKPEAEFARLLHVQKDVSMDIAAYHQSLAASYLVCNSESAIDNLETELETQLNEHFSHDDEVLWLLCMLRYSLADSGESARKAYLTAKYIYQFLPCDLQHYLERRIPRIHDGRSRSRDNRRGGSPRGTGTAAPNPILPYHYRERTWMTTPEPRSPLLSDDESDSRELPQDDKKAAEKGFWPNRADQREPYETGGPSKQPEVYRGGPNRTNIYHEERDDHRFLPHPTSYYKRGRSHSRRRSQRRGPSRSNSQGSKSGRDDDYYRSRDVRHPLPGGTSGDLEKSHGHIRHRININTNQKKPNAKALPMLEYTPSGVGHNSRPVSTRYSEKMKAD